MSLNYSSSCCYIGSRIGWVSISILVANPRKLLLHDGQSRSWSAEQGKYKRHAKSESLAVSRSPLPLRCLQRRKKKHTHTHGAYRYKKRYKKSRWPERAITRRIYIHGYLGATQVSVRLAPVQEGSCCCCCCLKKNLNAPRPSEHPPVRGKKYQNV